MSSYVKKYYHLDENEVEKWETDVRERETGNTVETIYSGESHEEACDVADEWNLAHGYVEEDFMIDGYDELMYSDCNPEEKYFASVYWVGATN